MYADQLTPILEAIQERLVEESIFTEDQIGLSLTEMPSSQLMGDFACNLHVAEGVTQEGQVTGGGRWSSGYTDTINLVIYGRNALDRLYLDTSLLTHATLGLLGKSQATFDALQLFLPVNEDDEPLAQEPIRLMSISQPTKYPKSPEWSMLTMEFEVRSSFNINPLGP